MASFTAYLNVFGDQIRLRQAYTGLEQEINVRTGFPRAKVRGNLIVVELDTGELSDRLHESLVGWVASNTKTEDGFLDYTRTDLDGTDHHWWWKRGYCVGYYFSFDSRGRDGQPAVRIWVVIGAAEQGYEKGSGAPFVTPTSKGYEYQPAKPALVPAQGGPAGLWGNLVEDTWNDLTDNYISDPKQLEQLRCALLDQRQMLLEKQAALQRWNEADVECFVNSFGQALPQDRARVQGRIKQQLKLLDNEYLKNDGYKQKFFPSSQPPPHSAHVRRYGPDHEIFLARQFWTLDARNRAGALAHEMSHYYDQANLNDYGELGYGLKACRQLALNNSEMALDNADNFRYYLQGDLCP